MIENYLSQDLLRVTGQNKEDADALLMIDGRPTKDAFEGKVFLSVFTKVQGLWSWPWCAFTHEP